MRDPEHIALELTWYWRESSGDLGLCSNFGATELKLQGIYPSGYALRDPNPRALWAASRVARITRRLEQLDVSARRVLFAAYGDGKAPEQLQRLGVVAGVLLVLDDAVTAWRASRSTRELEPWLGRLFRRSSSGKGSIEDRQTIGSLISKAQRALAEAERKYSRCW